MTLSTATIEAWYKRYGPMVYRRCLRLLGREEWAKEALQEVFLRVWEQATILEEQAPAGLLYRIATNVSLNLIRSRKARPETPDGGLVESLATAPDAEAATVAKQTLEIAFSGQQVSTRVIATLHLLDGMTLEEVAAEVGLSVSGVRKRLASLKNFVQGLDGYDD